ncbi:MAG TPA: DUF6596 domain-containing protein, partial [Gemmatimonadales bacterium]
RRAGGAGAARLMLLVESRRAARTSPEGSLVLLADQDRGLWDRGLVAEGQAIVRECLRRNRPGPYQLQAAINAVHSDAPTAAATDWEQILRLYDQLMAMAPSPIVALNRAVVVAEVSGPAEALRLVEDRAERGGGGGPTTRRSPGAGTAPSGSFWSADDTPAETLAPAGPRCTVGAPARGAPGPLTRRDASPTCLGTPATAAEGASP